MAGYVYILASQKLGTLYIGVTSNIGRRIWEHREGLVDGFTKQYGIKTLVYLETFDRIDDAIFREKQLKKWNRQWKINLIEAANPDWKDLSSSLL